MGHENAAASKGARQEPHRRGFLACLVLLFCMFLSACVAVPLSPGCFVLGTRLQVTTVQVAELSAAETAMSSPLIARCSIRREFEWCLDSPDSSVATGDLGHENRH